MLLAPVMFVAVYELMRVSVVGPTVDAIHPGSFYGLVALAVGRGFHWLVALLAPISADHESGVSGLMICCSGCAALAGQPWCRSGSRLPILGRCGPAGGDVLHRWRRCARDLVQGARTSSSKPLSTRVDSVGADPRQMIHPNRGTQGPSSRPHVSSAQPVSSRTKMLPKASPDAAETGRIFQNSRAGYSFEHEPE